jgi:phage baseplate assembly protein W
MTDPEREREIFRRRLLGQGLACTPTPTSGLGRDLELISGPQGVDLVRVVGIDNLGQALAIALTTLLGSDVFNTEFGFDGLNAVATESDPILLRERVRIAVIQVLRRDPRVRRVVDVKLGEGPLEAGTPGSRELEVKVLFETVTGDQSTVDLGGRA